MSNTRKPEMIVDFAQNDLSENLWKELEEAAERSKGKTNKGKLKEKMEALMRKAGVSPVPGSLGLRKDEACWLEAEEGEVRQGTFKLEEADIEKALACAGGLSTGIEGIYSTS